jgi:hypothetical protein
MKSLLTFIILTFTLLSFAAANEKANYNVKEGKLHKGGALTVETFEDTNEFRVKANYEIYKRSWVPVSNDQLKGEEITTLPNQFKDERGYLELEEKGEMVVLDAKIKFIKRVDYKDLKDAYLIEVLPNNGKSKSLVTYHPSIPAAGWANVEIIFISNINLLNGYKLIAEIK